MSERPAPLLEVESLEVRYGRVAAVRGLSFTAGRGEVVALVGPNGAGKSTTLHAIMGLVPPSGGDVRLHGRSTVGLAPEAVARSGVALVPEGRHVFPHFTVEENLRLGLVARRAKDGAREDLRRVYDLFPVVEQFRSRPAGLLTRTSCSSTSPRAGSLPPSSTRSSTPWRRSAARGLPSSSWSSARSWRSASRTGRT